MRRSDSTDLKRLGQAKPTTNEVQGTSNIEDRIDRRKATAAEAPERDDGMYGQFWRRVDIAFLQNQSSSIKYGFSSVLTSLLERLVSDVRLKGNGMRP